MAEKKETPPDISVIVPMYNVELFLPRCVESIINQTYKNIEIILVDDESPDRSGEIAEEYAAKDKRIKVIHQKNKWLGGARNSGIKIATGKYIIFVDSDDYIREDMCEILFRKMEQYQTDMIIFGTYHIDRHGKIQSTSAPNIQADVIYRVDDVQRVLFPMIISSHSINSACMKIYKRSLFTDNNLLFDEIVRYAEDYEFVLRLFPHLTSFMHIEIPLYYYVENESSIMHTQDKEIMNKFIILYQYREQFLLDQNIATADNRRLSSELLITMVVKNYTRFLGTPNKQTKQQSIELIDDLLAKPEITESLKRIDLSKMDLGIYGKLMIRFMKNRKAKMIYRIYVYQKKKSN